MVLIVIFSCLFTISTIISDLVLFGEEAFHNKSCQTRKSYPLPFKLMIIEDSKRMNSVSEVARKHSINKSMVVKWRQDEIKIRNALESHGSQTNTKRMIISNNYFSNE